MTDCLNTPVVTVPLMVTIGTGTNAGYLDFNIDPEDLNPPDEEFWKEHLADSLILWWSIPRNELYLLHGPIEDARIPMPTTKAHAKMLIHLLTGRTDLWNPPKDRSTMPTDGQGGETT